MGSPVRMIPGFKLNNPAMFFYMIKPPEKVSCETIWHIIEKKEQIYFNQRCSPNQSAQRTRLHRAAETIR